MKRSTLLIGVLAAGLLLAACGGGSDDAGSTPTTPAATATVNSPQPSATQSATSGETRVAMEDFRFVPSSLTVASGTTLELDNEGEAPHTFTVDGQSIDVHVNAGENGTVTIDLPAGTYDFHCTFHQSQGMTGTLTVS